MRYSITSILQLNIVKLGVLLGNILNNVFRDPTAIWDHIVQPEHWHEKLSPLLQLKALVSTEIEPTKKVNSVSHALHIFDGNYPPDAMGNGPVRIRTSNQTVPISEITWAVISTGPNKPFYVLKHVTI